MNDCKKMSRSEKKGILRNSSFTLLETLVTLIILSAIVAFAFRAYGYSLEKSKASEGASILYTLLGSQKRYFLDNNSYATDLSALDVTLPAASNNFGTPEVFNDTTQVARITRAGNIYRLKISSDGVISCDLGSICKNIGY